MEPNERPPPWYPFRPSDKRIMYFLNLKLKNQSLPMNDIHDVNVFDGFHTPNCLAGRYNYNEENNEIYFFSNPRLRCKWRAETGTDEVITDENGGVIGYKRRLAYTSNADSPLKWHMQEYMGNEQDSWAVYKLYTTTVKTRIEGNPTGTAPSHSNSDIGSSIIGTSGRWPWPAPRRKTRPSIAPVSTTSSSQQALPNAIPSQTSHQSIHSNIIPSARSSYLSYQNLTSQASSSSTTLPPFGTPLNLWESQDWNTSLHSVPIPTHHYLAGSSFHPQSHQSFQGSTLQFAVPSQTSYQSFQGSTFPFACPSQPTNTLGGSSSDNLCPWETADLRQCPESTASPPSDAELWQQVSSSANLEQYPGSTSLPVSSSADLEQYLGSTSLPPSDAELWQQVSSSADLEQYPGSTSLPPSVAEIWEQALKSFEEETQQNNPHDNQGVNPSQF